MPKKYLIDIDKYPYREGFPSEEEDLSRRPLFFDQLGPLDKEALWQRGYVAKTLIELPRGTKTEERAYLLAKCQAIEEGTVDYSKDRIEALKLEMQANKLLGAKAEDPFKEKRVVDTDVSEILKNWGSSRHTLADNTTMTSAKKPAHGKKTKKRGKKSAARDKQ